MAGDREERIRQRAHEIWLSEGQPEGDAARHWEQAAREIDAEGSAKPAAVKKAPAKAKTDAPKLKKPAKAKKPSIPSAK